MADVIGAPNQRGLEMLYNALTKWIDEGCICYQCQECYAPLKTEEERDAHFCKKHLTTRKVFTDADALETVRRGQARREARARASRLERP